MIYTVQLSILIILIVLYLINKIKKGNKAIKNIYIALVFTIYIIYIAIRILSVPINFGVVSSILGISLLVAEIMGFMAFCTYITIFKDQYKLPKKTIKDLNGETPTVDVLICTYNEEISLLEKTILASTRIKYPKEKIKVYVLDDGKNNELKLLCEHYNVNYITRENNEFAKAGNINNALKIIKGEYFLILDADMIPYPDILERAMGYFENKNLAFVQTPQTFYNPDVYQFNVDEEYNNEQDFFMRYIEQARASKDAVLHVGTNAIFRREYVLNVGGYPTSSITEDMALGLLLQAEGYDSVFVNEELVCGLSATTYDDLVKQRDRWCRGNLQVIHNFKKVILKKLKLMQKIIYFDGVLYWLSGVTKTLFLIMPIFGFMGIPIVDRFAGPLIPLFFLSFASQILLSKIILPEKISKKYTKFFSTGNIYNTVMAPHLTFSVIKHYTHSDFKFNVTDKGNTNEKPYYNWKLAMPHIIISICLLITFVISIFKVKNDALSIQAFLINLFWMIYNLPGLFYSLKIAYQPIRNKMDNGIELKEKKSVLVDNNSKCIEADIIKVCDGYINIQMNDNSIDETLDTESRIKIDNKWIDAKVINTSENICQFELLFNNYEERQIINNIFLDNLTIYKNNLTLELDK